MSAWTGRSDKATSFCFWFVETGGRMGEAARRAGYRPAGAPAMATQLMRNPAVVEAIVAQIQRKAPGHEKALACLLSESRPAAVRQRVAELICRAAATQALPSAALDATISPETGQFPAERECDPLFD